MKKSLMSIAIVVSVISFNNVVLADFAIWGDETLSVTGSHNIGATYDTSVATIVSGGTVQDMSAYNSSTVDISGGAVSGYLDGYNDSNISLSSGSAYVFNINNQSEMNITGGSIGSGGYVNDFGVLSMSDGTFSHPAGYINAEDDSRVYISGGAINGTIHPLDNSEVNITGGTIGTIQPNYFGTVNFEGGICNNEINARGSSTVNISGGLINRLRLSETPTINFYATEYHLGSGLTLSGNKLYGEGFLSGEWADGIRWTIDIDQTLPSPNPDITLHLVEPIPEPATLLLLGLGTLALRRKRGR